VVLGKAEWMPASAEDTKPPAAFRVASSNGSAAEHSVVKAKVFSKR